MENTEVNLNQIVPHLYDTSNPKPTNLPFDVENDLKKYSRIYISKEFDPFRLVHCFEVMNRDYKIYGEIIGEHNVPEKKLLFSSVYHFQCCNCCDQCIIGCLCCGYACCDSIQFQMDYRRNGEPFYTQGINISKGCHCCDLCLLNFGSCCNCSLNKLYLRENIDPDSPDIKVGNPKGFTEANCCCSCD